ncbi:MAG: DUF134 domain-containing protein [Candidatus Latescibacteria bacterium]|nr:DUF134 domain-containing protein [bacterium]MBD3424147.1 DUF134 domain-containing protein [Candidatus Latescibacterota bacterium]
MPRRKKYRTIANPPIYERFKPVGVRARGLVRTEITLDEYEAIRLADGAGLSHAAAARKMEISRSTFTRLIARARGKVADFLINGRLLCVAGGCVHFRRNIIRCLDCGFDLVIDIGESPAECPGCGSDHLADLATGFGQGIHPADKQS